MNKRICILFLVGAFSAVCGARAAVIQDLASRADLIVVGAVPSRVETQDSVSFDILVQRNLKGGQALPSLHVEHAWRRSGVVLDGGSSVINRELDGIWFLHKDGSNWDVLPATGHDGIILNLFLPAVAAEPLTDAYSASSTVTDKIVIELAAGLLSTNTQPEVLLHTLGDLDSAAVTNVVNQFLQSKNDSFRAVALSVLLARGKAAGIEQLGQMWPSISKTGASASVILALRESFRDTSPSSVSQLADIATRFTSSPDLRAAAIHALRAVHTRESLPFLATLLASSDTNEQMEAIIGISSFANGCPPQTPANVATMEYMHFSNPSPYRNEQTLSSFAFGPVESQRESELLEFWSGWWNQHKGDFAN